MSKEKVVFAITTFFSMVLFSCGSTRESQDLDEHLAWSGKNCFEYSENGNQIRLSANFTNGIAYGNLDYEWAEKDANHGTIEGQFRGDTLVAIYTFQSEGLTSKRQVVFLFDKDLNAREGFGNTTEKDHVIVYNKIEQLNFEKTPVLKKVECE